MDDDVTATYIVVYNEHVPVDRYGWIKLLGYDNPLYDPATCDVRLNWNNRLGQERESMSANWTGIQGLEMEDFAMSLSLHPSWDRSKEHLVKSDLAVVRMRRMVLQAVRRFAEGEAPPGVNIADMTKVIAYDRDLDLGEEWQEFAPDNRRVLAG